MTTRRSSSRTRRWRALYFATLGGAVAALVAGIAFATGGTGVGSATTGSVTLSVNSPATHTCTYVKLLPGDLPNATPCTLSVNYTGSISAFVSLTVAIQSKAGAGGQPLYDGTNVNGLTFTISDGTHSFVLPTGAGTVGGSCPLGFTCWTAPNELSAWYSAGPTANLTFTNTNAVAWTVTPFFPATAKNGYQGATANLILTAQAVQAPANPLPAGCTTSTIGHSCLASSPFTWN